MPNALCYVQAPWDKEAILALILMSAKCSASTSAPAVACEASLAEGNPDQAIETCSNAIALNPLDAASHSNRGAAYLFFNMLDKALQDLEIAAKLDQSNPNTFYNLGVYYDTIKSYEKSIEQYSIVIKLSSGNPIAYFNRAKAFERICRNDEALKDYQKIMEIAPYMAKIRNIPTSINNGCLRG